MIRKRIEDVAEAEFRRFPVWRYTLQERPDDDESTAIPVAALPCAFMRGLAAVAVQLTAADGQRLFGVLSGLSPRAEINEHTLALEAFAGGERVRLARYYDLDFHEGAADAFAARFGATAAQMFPIAYDVSAYFTGPAAMWRGEIHPVPRDPLSEEDYIRLIVRAEDDV